MGKPTMDDVAQRAGVSRALVSLVMHRSPKVSATSRQAVLDAAAELGYRPNLIARNLASKTTHTLGLLINDLNNPYFPGVVDGVRAAALRSGYRVLLSSSFDDEHDDATPLDMLIDYRVDGVILTGTRIDPSAIERAAESVPTVVVSWPLDSHAVDTVNNDDRLGAALAVEHLVELGHREIVHIDGGEAASSPLRREGYESTMRRHGLDPYVLTGAYTEASGATATHELITSGHEFTAMFAGNDVSALGALDEFDAAGLSVPGDVSLVGYDNTFVAALRHVSLTSVDQDRERLGALAVETLIDRLERGRTSAVHHVVEPTLVIRNSTAPVTGGV
jgi:DNA-binding LacI/PurR family transcriptional regulator